MDWESVWRKAQEIGLEFGPRILAGLAILVGGWIAVRIVRAILKRLMTKARLEPTVVGFIANLAYILMMAIIIITALGQVGVATSSFVALIGATGLAVGFALQGSLSNFAAGVMIIFFRPFKVGDVIEGGGATGIVEEIQVFATVLNTADNKRIIVPNAALTSGNIVNYTANPRRRVDLVFGIGYADDTAKAKEVVREILDRHPLVLKAPAPEVVVGQLGDSAVNLYVRPWVKTTDYWTVQFEVTEAVKNTFDRQGISIPYPQRDVHLHQVA
jgi:small conductance mechanosensitive channel